MAHQQLIKIDQSLMKRSNLVHLSTCTEEPHSDMNDNDHDKSSSTGGDDGNTVFTVAKTDDITDR